MLVPQDSIGRLRAQKKWSSRDKWSNSSTASHAKYSDLLEPHIVACVITV